MTRFTVNGITDERDTCDCCGRTNLKRVVVLTDHEIGEFVYLGTTCAARAKGVTVKAIRQDVSAAEAAKREAARREAARLHALRTEAWHAHLTERVGHVITDWTGKFDTFAMIEACGGYAAANAGFRWSDAG